MNDLGKPFIFSLMSERILADEGQTVQKPFLSTTPKEILFIMKGYYILTEDSSVIIDNRTKTLRLQYNIQYNTILFSHSETHII